MNYRITLESDTQFGRIVLPEKDEPIGVRDIVTYIRRDDRFHGIFPEATTSLKFICSGRSYIKSVYDTYGLIQDIFITIDFTCDDVDYFPILEGKLDLTEVVFTYQFAEVPIKPSNCLDKFLERLDTQLNLYEEPCFTELTYDKTAVRTRYTFAPYFFEFKSKTILYIEQAKLATDADGLYKNQKEWEVECGINGSVVYADANIPANVILGVCPSSPITPDYGALTMCVQFPIEVIFDDLDMLNHNYAPANNQVVVTKDCSNGDTGNNPQCTDSDYVAVAVCDCSLPDNAVPYTINLDIELRYFISAFWLTVQTDLLAYGVSAELRLEWGSFSTVLDSNPITWLQPPSLNGCAYENNFNPVSSPYIDLMYYGSININPCDVNVGDKLRIYVKYLGSMALEAATIFESPDVTFRVNTEWSKADFSILTSCSPDLVNIGATSERVYAVHEALSRVVEHYTNNCLRVKTCYFGRPNSLEGADNIELQTPPSCYLYSGGPVVSNHVYPNNPNNVFDPTPYQTGSNPINVCEDAGCGAWTVLTSGINLRAFGTAFFTSFNELYEALDCVFNIGVGYLDSENDSIRIENKEYFYQDQVILEIQLDEYNSKFTRRPYTEALNKRFITGYAESIKDEINTIDEFNTKREYNLLNTKIDGELAKQCEYIASGYTIEWQRRSRLSADAQYDDNKFIIATERFVGTQSPATGMYTNEAGVDNPSSTLPNPPLYAPDGLIDPATTYNWRLSPYYNTIRWASVLKQSTWKQPDELLTFALGETNFQVAGNEPGVHYGCDIDIDYDLPPTFEITHGENQDIHLQDITFPRAQDMLFKPEEVTFEYPITFTEYKMIRQNPYGKIKVNGEDFYIKEIGFQLNKNSNFTLLKA